MPLKVRNGSSAWSTASAIKVRNGSSAWDSVATGRVRGAAGWDIFFSTGVQLTNFNVLTEDYVGDGGFPNTTYSARSYVYFYSNGHYQLVSGNYNNADAVVEDRIWLNSGTASDYGVKITSTSGDALTIGAADTVYQLNSTRYYSMINGGTFSSGSTQKSNTFTIQIVSYPSGTALASASGTLDTIIGNVIGGP